MRKNDWQHSDQQRTTCRSGRKGAADGRCWTRRRDAAVLARKGGHLAKDFLGKKQGRLQLCLAAQQGEVGTPWTCSHAEGAGGPVLRPGEGSANTVAYQLPHQIPNWAVRIARLFRNHSKADGQLTAAASLDFLVAPHDGPDLRCPRAIPWAGSTWQTTAGQPVSTPTNMEAGTAAEPIFSPKVLRHTGRRTVPENARGPCVNLNSRRQWRVGAGCGPTQLAVPPANGELAIGRRSWPTTRGINLEPITGPITVPSVVGAGGGPPVPLAYGAALGPQGGRV